METETTLILKSLDFIKRLISSGPFGQILYGTGRIPNGSFCFPQFTDRFLKF